MTTEQKDSQATTDNAAPAVKSGIAPLFATPVYQTDGGPIHLNERLEALTRELMKDERNAIRRTNEGGWHYAFDLFQLQEQVVVEFRFIMEQHVQAFINHFRPKDRHTDYKFRLAGWINLNKAGDFNRLHCHPGCFLSATYYVKVPSGLKGGQLYFRDPRGPAIAMYETPGIELPWIGTGSGVPFAPAAGRLFIFPSWLEHYVEPFEGDGERISIAFNVSNL